MNPYKERWTAVMLSVFGDDSSDETQQRTFSVAGVMASEEEWKRLDDVWLVRTRGIPFHATDCDSNRGAYAEIPHEENKALYKDLATILGSSEAWGWGAAIDLAAYREIFSADQEICYHKAFLEVVNFFAKFAQDRFHDQVKFTFDCRIQSNYSAGTLYDFMANEPDNSMLFDEISFTSSRAQPRIQMADLWARETMKELDNRIGPVKRPRRKSLIAMNNGGHFGADMFLREYFEDMRRKLPEIHAKDPNFNQKAYWEWLVKQKQSDTTKNRMKFLLWFMAKERSSH